MLNSYILYFYSNFFFFLLKNKSKLLTISIWDTGNFGRQSWTSQASIFSHMIHAKFSSSAQLKTDLPTY